MKRIQTRLIEGVVFAFSPRKIHQITSFDQKTELLLQISQTLAPYFGKDLRHTVIFRPHLNAVGCSTVSQFYLKSGLIHYVLGRKAEKQNL